MDVVKFLQGDRWLKHPVHPALVTLPIGMWVFSAVMDGIASATGNRCAQETADNAILGGLTGAGLAASTGIAEFLRVPNEEPTINIAVTHGSLNAAATALFGINAAIRSSRRKQGRAHGIVPKLLSLAGVGIIGYTGWLGGKMTYNHGVGVSLEQAISEAQGEQERTEAEERDQEVRAHM